MRTVLRPVWVVVLFLMALPVSAQRSGRSQDPTLNKGEGLEMSRSDLDKIRNQKQDKNSRQIDAYMFAASFSLLDSILYVSEVQLVKDVTVNNKWFVKERLTYEKQFTDYIAGADENESLMTSLIFSDKEKKVVRKRERLIKRNKKKNGFALYMVSGFTFSTPESTE